MCIIGIDLGVTAKHRAVIADETGRFTSPIIKFRTQLPDLERLYAQARAGSEEQHVAALELFEKLDRNLNGFYHVLSPFTREFSRKVP